MIRMYLIATVVSIVIIVINIYLNNRFGYDWLPMYATDYKSMTYGMALLVILSSPFIAFIIVMQLFIELLVSIMVCIDKIINKTFLTKRIFK